MFIEMGPMLEALSLACKAAACCRAMWAATSAASPTPRRKPASRANQAALAQQLRQFFASSDVAGSAAGQIVDGIASGMMAGVDLSIPDLPAAALSAGGTWAPNADRARAVARRVAGMAASPPAGLHAAAGGVVPQVVSSPAQRRRVQPGGAWVQGPAQASTSAR
jgi:hypothetical protein